MGTEIAALLGLVGLSSAFALVAFVLAAWMAWRIVEKAGLPGWTGLGAILLTLTAIGTIVPLVLLWIFAFMRWPRDTAALAHATASSAPGSTAGGATAPSAPPALPPTPKALSDSRGWTRNSTATPELLQRRNGGSLSEPPPARRIPTAGCGRRTDRAAGSPERCRCRRDWAESGGSDAARAR